MKDGKGRERGGGVRGGCEGWEGAGEERGCEGGGTER